MNELRWSNVGRARKCYDTSEEILNARPLEAFFEVAARCNLHCQMCAINYDARYQPRSGRPPLFSPDLFQKLEPIFPSLVRAYLFGLGEPVVNPHLVDYVRKLSSYGVEVWFNTNATLIDEKKADQFAEAGVQRITVSIDGATAETYERIRAGATFDAVIRGIRALLAAQRKHGRPIVNFSFVAMASNIAELPQLVDLCAELGAEGIHVEPLFAQHQAELEDHYRRENLGVLIARSVSELFNEAVDRATVHGVRIASRFLREDADFNYLDKTKKLGIDWKCSEPWSSIWVTSAGEVRTCCINETSFGNLFEKTFDEIWNGPEFVQFRRQHASRQAAVGCGNCVRNGRVRNSPFFTPIHAVTYRPIERRSSAGPSPIEIVTPALGETITDPIVISGRILSSGAGSEWELMLDEEPLGVVRRDNTRGDFALHGPVPFITEGAHLLWVRRRGDVSGPGYCYREIHLWRPAEQEDTIRSTSHFAVRHFAPKRINEISAEIDGMSWENITVLQTGDYAETSRIILFDLTRLQPGIHSASIVVNRERSAPVRLHRLRHS